MRLIDADALFNWGKYKLSDAVKYGNKDEEHQDFSYSTLMMYEIADEVNNAPTIDAVPVVRGRWRTIRGNYVTGGGNPIWGCSKCNYIYGATMLPPKYKYCPNCGAKMEVEP